METDPEYVTKLQNNILDDANKELALKTQKERELAIEAQGGMDERVAKSSDAPEAAPAAENVPELAVETVANQEQAVPQSTRVPMFSELSTFGSQEVAVPSEPLPPAPVAQIEEVKGFLLQEMSKNDANKKKNNEPEVTLSAEEELQILIAKFPRFAGVPHDVDSTKMLPYRLVGNTFVDKTKWRAGRVKAALVTPDETALQANLKAAKELGVKYLQTKGNVVVFYDKVKTTTFKRRTEMPNLEKKEAEEEKKEEEDEQEQEAKRAKLA